MVTSLARHQRARGHAVAVASMYAAKGTWLERDLGAAAVELHFLAKRGGLDLRMVPRIARVLGRFRPDVVHTHMYALKYALPSVMARRCGAIHTVHTLALRETDPLSRAVHRLAFTAGVVPVAVGGAVADSMQVAYRSHPRRIIPNGIPVAEFASSPVARRTIRDSLRIPPEAPVFLMVARFSHPKNHEAAVTAFSSARLRALGARLLLAGDGELRPDVERQVEGARLGDFVSFLGVRSDVPRLLASADVFLLPSRVEGAPLSVMEAMAAGIPVVATAVGSIPELVPPTCGELASPGDVGALERAMYRLASDRALAREKGAAALQRARQCFDVSTMAEAYEELYRDVA
jgi:glycosyltransferase involved in cell wall biosynthesis